MLGNYLPIKRVYEMVLTLAELRERGYDFTLNLAGKPRNDFTNERYYVSLLGAIDRLGLGEKVLFHGWVDAAEWLPEMDIYISNSYWEGQQNALVEAMAAGCYSLCHFWTGAEEILPEECLFTTETSLIEKIIQYVEMPDVEKQQWQDRMHSIAAEKFNLADAILNYRALLEEVGK